MDLEDVDFEAVVRAVPVGTYKIIKDSGYVYAPYIPLQIEEDVVIEVQIDEEVDLTKYAHKDTTSTRIILNKMMEYLDLDKSSDKSYELCEQILETLMELGLITKVDDKLIWEHP